MALKEELETLLLKKYKINNLKLPKEIATAVQVLKQKNPQIHEDIVLLMLLIELSLVVGSFRKPIQLDPRTKVTVSTVAFCLANSGYGKDSTKSLISSIFDKSYDLIDTKRKEGLLIKAVDDAIREGHTETEAYTPAIINKFLQPLEPLKASISTNEGFIQHLNLLDEINLGCGYLYTGEFADMLSSALLIDNITLISELYDLGNKEVKIIKDKTKQSKELKGMPVTALFVGSLDLILNTDKLKQTLKLAFSSKLARRSMVFYSTKKHLIDQSISLDEYLSQNTENLENVFETLENISNLLEKNTNHFLNTIQNGPFVMNKKALNLYNAYKVYCTLKGEELPNEKTLYKLTITNQYWKALKLAPLFAFLKKRNTITMSDMFIAITIVENYAKYTEQLENELSKETHEALCTYALNNLQFVKNSAKISTHTLQKLGFVKASANAKALESQVRELLILANSSANNILFEMNADNSVTAFKLEQTEKCGISYVKVTGTKQERAMNCRDGYKYSLCDFNQITQLLKKDAAYSTFEIKNGVRLKENIVPTTNVLVLDIDQTDISFKDMHRILRELNHIIVKTSDPNNEFKYRILLELDTKVTFSDSLYKKTLKAVGELFGITPDLCPYAQVFFSYADREILAVTDGVKLDIKNVIAKIQEEVALPKPPKELNHNMKQEYMQDKERKFWFAMNPPMGHGEPSLYNAYRLARDVGFTKQEIIDLIYWLNNQWSHPMDISILAKGLIRQIEKDENCAE